MTRMRAAVPNWTESAAQKESASLKEVTTSASEETEGKSMDAGTMRYPYFEPQINQKRQSCKLLSTRSRASAEKPTRDAKQQTDPRDNAHHIHARREGDDLPSRRSTRRVPVIDERLLVNASRAPVADGRQPEENRGVDGQTPRRLSSRKTEERVEGLPGTMHEGRNSVP
nr:predicted protein [Mycena chlorophos]